MIFNSEASSGPSKRIETFSSVPSDFSFRFGFHAGHVFLGKSVSLVFASRSLLQTLGWFRFLIDWNHNLDRVALVFDIRANHRRDRSLDLGSQRSEVRIEIDFGVLRNFT